MPPNALIYTPCEERISICVLINVSLWQAFQTQKPALRAALSSTGSVPPTLRSTVEIVTHWGLMFSLHGDTLHFTQHLFARVQAKVNSLPRPPIASAVGSLLAQFTSQTSISHVWIMIDAVIKWSTSLATAQNALIWHAIPCKPCP